MTREDDYSQYARVAARGVPTPYTYTTPAGLQYVIDALTLDDADEVAEHLIKVDLLDCHLSIGLKESVST